MSKHMIDQYIEGRETPSKARKVIDWKITITRQHEGYTDYAKFTFTTFDAYHEALLMLNAAGVKPFMSGPRYEPIVLDYSQIEDVQVANIRMYDAPDFVDAFIESATYVGRDMTGDELDALNEDSDYVYKAVQNALY